MRDVKARRAVIIHIDCGLWIVDCAGCRDGVGEDLCLAFSMWMVLGNAKFVHYPLH